MDPAQKKDLEALLQLAEPFARPLLEELGGFYPFALVMTQAGSTEAVEVEITVEQPKPKEVLEDLLAALRDRSEQYRALAVCADGTIPVDGARADAVLVQLEHQGGASLEAAMPYRRTDDGVVRFGETVFMRRQPRVFAV